jgi:hypothetical protein
MSNRPLQSGLTHQFNGTRSRQSPVGPKRRARSRPTTGCRRTVSISCRLNAARWIDQQPSVAPSRRRSGPQPRPAHRGPGAETAETWLAMTASCRHVGVRSGGLPDGGDTDRLTQGEAGARRGSARAHGCAGGPGPDSQVSARRLVLLASISRPSITSAPFTRKRQRGAHSVGRGRAARADSRRAPLSSREAGSARGGQSR